MGVYAGLTGILKVLAEEKDIHRVATDWANSYGPILRVRVMQFHVCPLRGPHHCILVFLLQTDIALAAQWLF